MNKNKSANVNKSNNNANNAKSNTKYNRLYNRLNMNMNKTAKISLTAILILSIILGVFYTINVFAAEPTMTAISSTTDDINGDGTIDKITITFSEAVKIVDGNAGDGLGSIALSESCTIPNSDYGSLSTTTLVITGLTGCNAGTGITPTVTYTIVADCTTAGAICDVATTTQMADTHQITSTDGADPVISSAAPATNAYIKVQQVSYTLSEAVTSGVIVFTRTGGSADVNVHTCTLQGTALNTGAHTDLTLITGVNACADWANPLVDGAIYTVTFDATDVATNAATQITKTDVTYDVTASTVAITAPATSTRVKGTATFTFTSSEPGTQECNINGGTWESCASGDAFSTLADFAGVGEVAFTLNVRDTDTAGNVGTDAESFVKDTTAPTVVITTTPTTPSKTKVSLIFRFEFNEIVTGFTAGDITLNFAGLGAGVVDGSTFTAINGSAYTLELAGQDATDLAALLTDTTVVAEVTMTGLADEASNDGVGTTSQTWTYDATAPVISAVSIPDVAMKVGSVVNAIITTVSDADTYTLTSGTIGGFSLVNLSRTDATTYVAQFTVTDNGANVAAGSAVDVANLVLTDSATNPSAVYGTDIVQAADAIDANLPVISAVSIPDVAMKVGSVVNAVITVDDDTVDGGSPYTLTSGTIGGFSLVNLSRTDATTYVAQFTVTDNGANVAAGSAVDVANLVLTDSATNPSAVYGTDIVQAADAIDANLPVISAVSIPDVAMKVGSVVNAVITVDDDTVDGGSPYTLTSGTIGGFSLVNLSRTDATTYVAQFTVTDNGANVAAGSAVDVANLVLTDSATNPSAVYGTDIVQAADAIDANLPVISAVSIPDVAMKVGSVVNAVITVDDDTVDGGSPYTLTSGTIGGFSLVNLSRTDATTYVAQFTVTDNGANVAAGSAVDVANLVLTDSATNPSAVYGTDIVQAADAIDANLPVISAVSIPDVAMKVGSVVNAVITVDDDTVDGGSPYTLTSGTIGGFSLVNLSRTDATTYVAQFTVTNGGTDVAAGSNVSVANLVLTDSATNPSAVYSTPISQASDPIDANRPTVISATMNYNDNNRNLTITFSETIDASATVTNGIYLSNAAGGHEVQLSDATVSPDGTTLTFTLNETQRAAAVVKSGTPGGDTVAVVLDINADAILDIANNGILLSNGNAVTETPDTHAPSLLSVTPNDIMLSEADVGTWMLNITIVLSETVGDEVPTINFNPSVNTSTLNCATVKSGSTVTRKCTFADTNLELSDIDVVVNGVYDLSSNQMPDTTENDVFSIDTVKPLLNSVVVTDTALMVGETSLVTFTFSEAVTNFANADLTIVNGGLTAVSSVDNVTWTATFTPTDDFEDASNVITVAMTTLTDAAGNAGLSTVDSNNYAIDTKEPTLVSAVFTDDALMVGETSLVTIIFSEPIFGFNNTDLTVVNGGLTAVSSVDNVTWTATFTPTDDFEDASNVITVAMTTLTDAAGNAGLGTADSSNYAIDTKEPTLVSAVFTDNALKVTETSLVTFTFSEAVTGFANADLTIVNGGLTAVASGDGVTWTATFTPTDDLEDTSNVITVALTGVADAAGNAGLGTTNSSNYAIDTKEPTVAITLNDYAFKIDDTATVVFNFSEEPVGFDLDDVTNESGVLSSLTNVSATIYTATFTPANITTDPSNVITVGTGWTDIATNAPIGSTNSANYEVDTVRPTVTDVIVDTATVRDSDLTQLVIVNYSENMNTAVNPTITFDVGTWTPGAAGVWADATHYSRTYTLTDNAEEFTGVNITVTLAEDAAGNTQTQGVGATEFNIDTKNPTATVTTTVDPIYEGGLIQTVRVTYTESMNAATTPVITLNGTNWGAQAAGSWTSVTYTNDTYTTTRVHNGAQERIANVIATVLNASGATDVAGNTEIGDVSPSFVLDTQKPYIVSANATPDPAKAGTVTVTIVFDDLMNNVSASPNVTVTGLASSPYTVAQSSFVGTTWIGTFTLLDNNEETTATITATGAKDVAGNTMAVNLSAGTFDVDTINPINYITNPAAGSTVSSPFQLSVDTDGTTAGCKYNEGSTFNYASQGTVMTSSGTSYNATVSVANGAKTYYVVCADTAGNVVERSRTFTVSTYTYGFSFPDYGNVFDTNITEGWFSQSRFTSMGGWNVNTTMSEFLTSNAGPTDERSTTDDFDVVYTYNDLDGWTTVDDADFATFKLGGAIESLNYLVFDLVTPVPSIAIRHS